MRTNLRMLTADQPRLMPSSTTWSRWPSGSIASTNGRLMSIRRPTALEHPLDQLLHLGAGEDQVGQLVPAAAGHEDPAGVVDPDLLDGGVVEERLERAEAGHPGHQLADHRVDVGDRSDDAGQAALVVGAHHGLGETSYDERVALRVDTLAAHGLAHSLVERLDQVGVRVCGDDRQRRSLPSKRSVSETYGRGRLLGKGSARICG